MSTLTISIIALIAFVVGAVFLFNLWQARGNRRLAQREHERQSDGFKPPAGESGRGRPGRDVQGRAAGGRRWQPGNDQNAWARQRREPTLTADDEVAPTPRFAPHSFDAPDHSPGFTDRSFPMSAGDGDQDGAADPDDDLGPPQFEVPRLEPAALKPVPLDIPRFEPPRFDPSCVDPSRPEPTRPFENTQPFGAGAAVPVRPAPVVNATVVEGLAGIKAPIAPVAGGAGDTAGEAAVVADEPVFVPADVDHVVTLMPRTPVNAERLIALTSSLRHVGSKSVRIEIDGGQGRWVPLQSGTMVGCLRCSVLLANRQGPLNAVELSDFSAAVESLAGQIGARFVPPDMNQVLRQARELDAVAARLDTQVDLGVEAAEPITPNRLAAVARKLDLFDRGAGRFAGFGEGGELLYLLTAGETADMLAFVLDVPRTAQAHDPWRSMVACASSCAQLVGGRVVDGAGRGMSVGMIDSVGQQIHKRYQELADVGLKAGSPEALRMFN